MNVLLDTHAIIWFIEGDDRLSTKASEIITNGNNLVCISVVYVSF